MKMNWELKKWTDVLEVRSGRSHLEVETPKGKYPILGSAGKPMGYTNEFICEEGTTIIGRKGNINNPIYIETKFWNIDTAFGLIASKILDKKFLYYFCLSYDFNKRDKGSGRPSLVKKDIQQISIPIPPLPEQKQIVAILDKAFAAIDQAKANIEKNIENAKELFQSKLNEIFSQKGEGWEERRFGDVCKFVRGPFGGSLKKSYFKATGFAVYEQQHAINNQFTTIRYFIDDEKFEEMKRFELNSGDVIMSCSGTMGKVAIVPNDIKKGIINQALLKLTPNKLVDRKYLTRWMESTHFFNEIAKNSKGAAIKNVASVKVLKEIKIPLASKQTQIEIVNSIDLLENQTNSLLNILLRKLKNTEELKKSILQKAFSGELTKDFN
jgi:type I restriction enzyme S subunit